MAIALAAQEFFALAKTLDSSVAAHNPRASQVDPNAIPSRMCEVDPNAISHPLAHLLVGQFQIKHRSACNGRRTLQNPGSLKGWLETLALKSRSGSGSRWFLPFGRGVL
jgi:hypothetical protein